MEDTSTNMSILYIDDDQTNLQTFKAIMRREKCKVFTTTDTKEAKQILDKEKINIILCDERMPKMTGVEFFESIVKEHPNPIRIITTAYADVNVVIDAINKGQVYRYLSKPWNIDCLLSTIYNAYELYVLRESNENLISDLKRFNKELIEVNKQLEFMLHQKKSFE